MIPRSLRRTLRFSIIVAFVLLEVYLLWTTFFDSSARRGLNSEAEKGDIMLKSPFVNDEPKLVILLSYQRSGSSFVGEWFNMNPDVFYNFEPVDSLYSAMYGTPQNLNVPSDITNYPNGSIRVLPEEELNAVSRFLHKFLHCDLDSLPTQALMSFYFIVSPDQFKAVSNYSQCLGVWFRSTFRQCEPYLMSFCGSRFGVVSEARQKECFRRKWLRQEVESRVDDGIKFRFAGHLSCLEYQRRLLNAKCQHLLLDVCRIHRMRVIKTVRATMESMVPLLKTLPNFRVIHLVRDPRGVALSRKLFDGNVLGIYSGDDTNTIAKEAKLYCSTVVRDIKTRRRLEKEYPGKIYTLLYDELITNTTLYLEQMYEFLGTKPPLSVVKWLSTSGRMNSQSNKTSEQIVRQWQCDLDAQIQCKIAESCKEFYQLTPFKWDFNHNRNYCT